MNRGMKVSVMAWPPFFEKNRRCGNSKSIKMSTNRRSSPRRSPVSTYESRTKVSPRERKASSPVMRDAASRGIQSPPVRQGDLDEPVKYERALKSKLEYAAMTHLMYMTDYFGAKWNSLDIAEFIEWCEFNAIDTVWLLDVIQYNYKGRPLVLVKSSHEASAKTTHDVLYLATDIDVPFWKDFLRCIFFKYGIISRNDAGVVGRVGRLTICAPTDVRFAIHLLGYHQRGFDSNKPADTEFPPGNRAPDKADTVTGGQVKDEIGRAETGRVLGSGFPGDIETFTVYDAEKTARLHDACRHYAQVYLNGDLDYADVLVNLFKPSGIPLPWIEQIFLADYTKRPAQIVPTMNEALTKARLDHKPFGVKIYLPCEFFVAGWKEFLGSVAYKNGYIDAGNPYPQGDLEVRRLPPHMIQFLSQKYEEGKRAKNEELEKPTSMAF